MKFLVASILAVAVSAASCAVGTRPITAEEAQVDRGVQSQVVVVQDEDEQIVDLGDGYQTKTRGNRVLIKFPESRYMTSEPVSLERFKEGIKIALVKKFGCSAFKDCEPKLESMGGSLTVRVGVRSYDVGPLFMVESGQGSVIGIVLSPLPSA